MRLTGLHSSGGSKSQNVVRQDSVASFTLTFSSGSGLSITSYYTKVRRLALPATRRCNNDPQTIPTCLTPDFRQCRAASNFCVESKVCLSYDLPTGVTAKLKRKYV